MSFIRRRKFSSLKIPSISKIFETLSLHATLPPPISKVSFNVVSCRCRCSMTRRFYCHSSHHSDICCSF
ncbi:hypothetical protein IC582_028930 [Cucumis melo]